jgi:hypothetical protein
MKALSLTQPWATLVAIGAKRIETRSWATAYRGPLAIHASKGFPQWAREFTADPVVYKAVRLHWRGTSDYPAYPLGAVVATCRLVSCIPTRELRENRIIETDPAACCGPFDLSAGERALGDYAPGRWAWLLADVELLTLPIPAKGALGLWEWPAA